MVHKKIGISKSFGKPKSIIFTSLVFVLALLVACGSAAQPAAEQQDPVKDTPKEVVTEKQAPKEAVTEKQAPKEAVTEKKDPKKASSKKAESAADMVAGQVPPTIVPGAVSRPAEAPA